MRYILRYNGRGIIILALLSGGVSVLLGAFGAHTLRSLVNDDTLSAFQKGVEYQFIHTVVLLFLGLYVARLRSNMRGGKLLGVAIYLFILGIFLFSGSLYSMAIMRATDAEVSIPIFVALLTPLGGICFVAGWMLSAAYMLRYYCANVD